MDDAALGAQRSVPRRVMLQTLPERHPTADIGSPLGFGEVIGGIFHEAPPAHDWRTSRPRARAGSY
eukprot:1110397-Heterocapsa_arctica.AAC.1